MITTKQLIEFVREKNDNCSDYRLAKILHVSRQSVMGYTSKGQVLSDEKGLEVASILGLDKTAVLMNLQAERAAKSGCNEAFELWNTLADSLADQILNTNANVQAHIGL